MFSNLKLQKLMYIAQVIHMGRNDGERLFDANFEAWDYGPVIPEIYHSLKKFGSSPVKDIFYDAKTFRDDDTRRTVMDDVCDRFLKYSAGDLVEITHSDLGAWAKYYVPGARNIIIEDEALFGEYKERNQITTI